MGAITITMTGEKQRVLVLYGGDAATNPRNELLAWLRGPSVNVDARVVAEDSPHSEGAVDDRVDAGMNWAQKAIAIVTHDPRSPHGAPNVMDEIGRWRGLKGKKTLCILRQEGVPPYSNHAGIVYVSFKDRVKEALEALRMFLGDAARPPARLASLIGGDFGIAALAHEIRTRELWDPEILSSVLAQVASLREDQRVDLLHILGDALRNEVNDDVRRNAAAVVEFLVQWAPANVPNDLLVTMAADSFFSVRSCAAVAFCHLARMEPSRVPLEVLARLASPDEDWYVVTPATTAMTFLARTRTVVLELLAGSIGTSEAMNCHLASAFAKVVKVAPAALRDDIADQMIESGHAELRAAGTAWKEAIKQRRSNGQPLDHYVF